ncbi:hypothetical protein HQN64_20420 [Enterobacteriaceae bacterium BIT-l23]|uniref:hypothetical protein n=1 Tax=Jejubacter sp. L23 TaxID=3092086 RepID=UPI001584932D|nr:hypothetical protein [Enterobacteriaceae bacterium BIT-l23]
MAQRTITLSRRQYRLICDALVNAVNMKQQLLAIVDDGTEHSKNASHNALTMLQVIEKQLWEGTGLREK